MIAINRLLKALKVFVDYFGYYKLGINVYQAYFSNTA